MTDLNVNIYPKCTLKSLNHLQASIDQGKLVLPPEFQHKKCLLAIVYVLAHEFIRLNKNKGKDWRTEFLCLLYKTNNVSEALRVNQHNIQRAGQFIEVVFEDGELEDTINDDEHLHILAHRLLRN